MNVTAKIVMDVVLKNEVEALEVLNKSMNDEFDKLVIQGCADDERQCFNLSIKEIIAEKDEVCESLYKTNGLDCKLVKSIRKNLESKDIILIDNMLYIIIVSDTGYNLYCNSLCKFYFEFNLRSIQEINEKLIEKDVIYEIYTALI